MKRIYLAVLLVLLAVAGAAKAWHRQDEFPHERHARLFPLCTGCHEGVPEGDRANFYPSPQSCAGCHNGTDQPRVSWNGPEAYAGNLDFSHPEHETQESLDCSACHTQPGAARMAIEKRVEPDRCFACHAHEAQNHFVDATCSQCHVPLSRTRLVANRIRAFPKPRSHEEQNFLEEMHGRLARTDRARCQVCHTRELCASCHVDAQQRAEVQAFDVAGPNVQLPAYTPRYFVPASHRDADWLERHGASARENIGNCSACHTRESCASCHAANTPKPVRTLPARAAVAAPGVRGVRKAPATHKAPFFEREHGTLAAAGTQTCSGCHARTQCEDCHAAMSAARNGAAAAPSNAATKASQQPEQKPRSTLRHQRAGYHPANFLERHASAAYNRNMECANCHETTRFCRACHEQRGMGTVGRLQPGFHDAQPLWLLNHGKPARQGLESCASCHKQTDCMQCHSDLGSFRVSPHGPGFDAKRVQQRNARLCFACHLSDPLQRGTNP